MKKFILICFFASFILGMAQEKKISFAKEFSYKMMEKNSSSTGLKIYASDNNEFLSKITVRDFPMYFFSDALGTSSVGIEMNNHLNGSGLSTLFGTENYGYDSDNKDEYILESKSLGTKETILGVTCNHYLINYKSKDNAGEKDNLKVCIDEKSPYNSFIVLNGILRQYLRASKIMKSDIKGLILKAGPEETYDKEYFILESMKGSKDFVYFDHKKAMTDHQRKLDSLTIAYKKQEKEYAKTDSAAVAADSVAIVEAPSIDDTYPIPPYVSEYKEIHEDGGLAISNISNENLWKGIPKYCRNLEKDLPEFNNKELKGHLKNYTGQMCDMYLTQAYNHSVGIKITLDEIRREVLYFNEVQDKLDQSDKKKLNNYLKNLD